MSPENAAALARLRAAGVEVVLASGRHHSTMHGIARELPGVRWMVSVQGAEVSDVPRTRILHQSFLAPEDVDRVLELGHELDFHALVYSHEGVFGDRVASVDTYEAIIGHRPKLISTPEYLALRAFKIVWAGDAERFATLATDERVVATPAEKLRSHRNFFEFVQPGVTKATGLAILAAELGIRREEILAFGDADNDAPMFDWVGTSVAMPHGWPSALARATHIAPAGPPESAVARGVDLVLRGLG